MPPRILKSAAEIVQEAIKKVDEAKKSAGKKASEALGDIKGKTLMGYNEGGSVAPYGLREETGEPKGKGYFGPIETEQGVMTELSVSDETGSYPMIVPTLTAEELKILVTGGEPTEEMHEKARLWADTRRGQGKSPFATSEDMRMPNPLELEYRKAHGGAVLMKDGGKVKQGATMNLEQMLQNALMNMKTPLKGERRYADGGSTGSSLYQLNFDGKALDREREAIMQEYGLSPTQLAHARSGWSEGAGLTKAQTDQIRSRLAAAANVSSPNDTNLATAVSVGGEAWEQQLKERAAFMRARYEEAMNSLKTPEQRIQEMQDYLSGKTQGFRYESEQPVTLFDDPNQMFFGTLDQDVRELENRYFNEIRQEPEALQRFIDEAKRTTFNKDETVEEQEKAAYKVRAWQQAQNYNSQMQANFGKGNFTPVPIPEITDRELAVLGLKRHPTTKGPMSASGGYWEEDDPLAFLRGGVLKNSLFGATLPGPELAEPMQRSSMEFNGYTPAPADAIRAGYTPAPPEAALAADILPTGSGITNGSFNLGGVPSTSSMPMATQPLDVNAAIANIMQPAATQVPVVMPPTLNINPVATPTVSAGTMQTTAAPLIDVQRIGKNLGAIPLKKGGRVNPDYKRALEMVFYQMRNKG